ncbi:YidC/Oxa1 family membrane protein insertase [Candidatus Saccharibacteria bacterium]|nr:YidC/Oxa1 family membrane protein insertase [Candidatus Saccharibacteria bacterium]
MFRLIDFLIVRPISNILFLIYNFVGDFGIAIILFVVLVKILMWPLVKKQLHQTKLMKKLQPELAEIKKNCNGNRQLESLQTMDLYKKYNVKPFASLLTVLIQLPIFIAIFSAIRVMATPPTVEKNLDLRAYSFVKSSDSHVGEVVNLQSAYLEEKTAYDEKQSDESLSSEEKEALKAPVYQFHPKLFGKINLEVKPGFGSKSAIIMLAFTIGASIIQFFIAQQQRPSGKNKKSKTFRQLMKEAGEGKELDQADINDMSSAQMAYMMPFMLLFIMINLPGAIVFYYFLSNVITLVQQKIILDKAEKEMEISADKAILKELKRAEEAEIIENKKTGTKITRISAKDIKKKRR